MTHQDQNRTTGELRILLEEIAPQHIFDGIQQNKRGELHAQGKRLHAQRGELPAQWEQLHAQR